MSVTQSTPVDERHALVRERTFPPAELERVLLQMHESRATGTLMLDITQGALNSIRFREEHKIEKGGSNVTTVNGPDALAHSAFLDRSRA
jgi:hypothetical protein